MANILSQAADKFKSTIPNPLVGAGLIAGIGIPAAYLLRPAVGNTAKTLLRPLGRMAGMSEQEYEDSMEQARNDKTLNRVWTYGIPGALAGAYLLTQVRPNAPYYGMTGWSDFTKQGSLKKQADLWEATGYQPMTDFAKHIDVRDVSQLFENDPYLRANNAYASQLGTSIVNAAPAYSNTTTLGGIFDSAVNKIENKLTFQGLASTAAKTLIANTAAHMLTGAIGAITSVHPKVRDTVISAGTWGAAVESILK